MSELICKPDVELTCDQMPPTDGFSDGLMSKRVRCSSVELTVIDCDIKVVSDAVAVVNHQYVQKLKGIMTLLTQRRRRRSVRHQ